MFYSTLKSSHSSRCPNLVNCPLQFFSNFPDFFLTWHRTSTQLYSETRWHLIGPKKQKPWSTTNSSISAQLTACSPEYHKQRPKFPIFQKINEERIDKKMFLNNCVNYLKKIPHLLIIAYTDLKGWEANFGSTLFLRVTSALSDHHVTQTVGKASWNFRSEDLIFDPKSYFDPKSCFWFKVLFLIQSLILDTKILFSIQSLSFDPKCYFRSRVLFLIQKYNYYSKIVISDLNVIFDIKASFFQVWSIFEWLKFMILDFCSKAQRPWLKTKHSILLF